MLRIACCAAAGVAATAFGVTGWWFALYLGAGLAAPSELYVKYWTHADADSYGDNTLFTESAMPGLGVFFLTWVLSSQLW